MSSYIKLKKDGFKKLTYSYELKKAAKSRGENISNDDKFYAEEEMDEFDILKSLRLKCVIDDGVTLKNFFDAVDKNEVVRFFVSQYSWCGWIEEFHQEASKPSMRIYDPKNTKRSKYYRLEISERIDIRDFGLDRSINFEVIGEGEEAYGTEGQEQNYGITGIPMSELANVPLVLREKTSIWDSRDRYNRKLLQENSANYTLLDVLDAVYWEISFHGGPQESAEFIKSLYDKVEQIKEDLAADEK